MTPPRRDTVENLSVGAGSAVGPGRWSSPQPIDAMPTADRTPRPLGAPSVTPFAAPVRVYGDDDYGS